MPLRRSVLARAARSTGTLAAVTALLCSTTAAYTVGTGETLSEIAQRHGTTTKALATANGISNPNRILAGQRLTIPAASATSAAGVHTVRRGESLSAIAARYRVRTADLAAANRIRNRNRIYAGQRLRIPGATSQVTPAAPVRAATHTVRRGDSLSVIARRYNVAMSTIMSANGIRNADHVRIGQRLRIPGATSQPSRSARQRSRAEVGAVIERTSRKYNWNPAFVKAVAWQESGWKTGVTSSVGAVGVMQVMPGTGRFVSTWLVGRDLNLRNTADNVEAGVAFLNYLHKLTGGDPEMILAGYYQGLGSVRRNGMYPSTRQYIRNVLALKQRFS